MTAIHSLRVKKNLFIMEKGDDVIPLWDTTCVWVDNVQSNGVQSNGIMRLIDAIDCVWFFIEKKSSEILTS